MAYLVAALLAYLAVSPLQTLAGPYAFFERRDDSSGSQNNQTANQTSWQDYTPQQRVGADCPDYNPYSQEPHGPYSTGPLSKVKSDVWNVSGIPSMRPSEGCRTFNSSAVEVSPGHLREAQENEVDSRRKSSRI